MQSYIARRDSGDIARTNDAYNSILTELRLRTDFKMIGPENCVDRAVSNPPIVSNARSRPRLRMMVPVDRVYRSPPPEIPKGVPSLERGRGCWDGSLNRATVATRGEVGALLKDLIDLPRALRKLESHVDYAAIEAEMVAKIEAEEAAKIAADKAAKIAAEKAAKIDTPESSDDSGSEDDNDGHDDDGDGHSGDDEGRVAYDDGYHYDDVL